MSRTALLGFLAAVAACTPRPWNFDETDRIAQVMGNGEEDPVQVAAARSVSAPELPDILPYRPVYVRPARDAQRRPAVRAKRTTTAERAKSIRSAVDGSLGRSSRAAPSRK